MFTCSAVALSDVYQVLQCFQVIREAKDYLSSSSRARRADVIVDGQQQRQTSATTSTKSSFYIFLILNNYVLNVNRQGNALVIKLSI